MKKIICRTSCKLRNFTVLCTATLPNREKVVEDWRILHMMRSFITFTHHQILISKIRCPCV